MQQPGYSAKHLVLTYKNNNPAQFAFYEVGKKRNASAIREIAQKDILLWQKWKRILLSNEKRSVLSKEKFMGSQSKDANKKMLDDLIGDFLSCVSDEWYTPDALYEKISHI